MGSNVLNYQFRTNWLVSTQFAESPDALDFKSNLQGSKEAPLTKSANVGGIKFIKQQTKTTGL